MLPSKAMRKCSKDWSVDSSTNGIRTQFLRKMLAHQTTMSLAHWSLWHRIFLALYKGILQTPSYSGYFENLKNLQNYWHNAKLSITFNFFFAIDFSFIGLFLSICGVQRRFYYYYWVHLARARERCSVFVCKRKRNWVCLFVAAVPMLVVVAVLNFLVCSHVFLVFTFFFWIVMKSKSIYDYGYGIDIEKISLGYLLFAICSFVCFFSVSCYFCPCVCVYITMFMFELSECV